MELEAVMNLFDSRWFELNVLKENSTVSLSTATSFEENLEKQGKEEESSEPELSRIQTSHHSRSMSDQSLSLKHDESLSPDSVLFHPKLQTILSGKEVLVSDSEPETNHPSQVVMNHQEEGLLPKKKKNTTIVRKKRDTKSLSDLEFEELKGFMDLGFVFTEEDKDSTLASIIPGLQRLGKKDEKKKESFDESLVPRPYLSEAWEVYDDHRRKKENPLMNWKVPALNNEIDMKDSLRWWAHTVASTVR